MRLELNLPALERLIGGDTELELSLRQQIVQEFARRHLKEVVNNATFQAAVEESRRMVSEAAKDAFGVEHLAENHVWPVAGGRLKGLVESLVRESAQRIVDEVLLKTIEYQKAYWAGELRKIVEKAMDRQIEKEVEEGIRRRLEAARNIGG